MTACPHCLSGASSVWDSVFECWAHPGAAENSLIVCHEPWRARLPEARATFEVTQQETGLASVREA